LATVKRRSDSGLSSHKVSEAMLSFLKFLRERVR
jgi:hypothetical protein